ncbi:hypothetical protein Agub_g3082 [Astrephomene gubernaculifera]|uniref:DNA mismatch repair proteins mutS family domain-containing protein n=1 Tax=Astrephomene gubernaculifera TaxID=47775 RepID=A0AAD3DKN1_9CHLO|nr:hypothetical protein Agub_g3082 [Astrephomene gubernaculifera]
MLAGGSHCRRGFLGSSLHRGVTVCARAPAIKAATHSSRSSASRTVGSALVGCGPAVAPAIPSIRTRNNSTNRSSAFCSPAPPSPATQTWRPIALLAVFANDRAHITAAGAHILRYPQRCHAGRAGFATSASRRGEASITPEAAAYWKQIMAGVDKPHLSSLVGSLDWEHPLGLSAARAKGHVQCYNDFLAAKKKHPTAVVLVRIGDFYEAVGYDALLLCQLCGLNPMSPHLGLALAGFPKLARSLRRYLNLLIEQGFAVAMVEEVGTLSTPSRQSKQRKLVSLVSASSPYYVYGSVEDECGGDDTPLPKPIVGVSVPGGGGFRLLQYWPQRRAVLVRGQLSLEALVAHLHAGGLAPPLHLHASVRGRDKEAGRGSSVVRTLSALLSTTVEHYGTHGGVAGGASCWVKSTAAAAAATGDDVEGFKLVVARQLGLDATAAERMEVLAPPLHDDTPVPPSLSTITQLGLAGARGVPSLLSAALPDGTPAPAREWMRRLLLLPPPPAVAEAIRAACHALANPAAGAPALPPLVTSVPGARISALLGEGVAGHNTLRELEGMLTRVVDLLRLPGPAAAALHSALGGVMRWSLAAHGGVAWEEVPAERFAAACAAAAAAIGDVVPPLEELAAAGLVAPEAGEESDASADEEEDSDAAAAAAAAGTAANRTRAAPPPAPSPAGPARLPAVLLPYTSPAGGLGALQLQALSEAGRLVRRMERFRLGVRDECMEDSIRRVSAARSAVVCALLDLAGVLQAAGVEAEMRMAPHDDAVWARLVGWNGKKLSAAHQRTQLELVLRRTGQRLLHPLNRKRAVEGERLSSEQLEAAAAEYRLAVEAAEKQSRHVLRQLCRRLYGGEGAGGLAVAAAGGAPAGRSPSPQQPPHLVTLLAACELSVVATALERHVARTKQAGWNWPAMPPASSLLHPGGEVGRHVALQLPGLWPFWMDRRQAVGNSLQLRAGRLALLTGPNMAGKSTVLRSVAAAALLAICGLSVPAGRGLSQPAPPAPHGHQQQQQQQQQEGVGSREGQLQGPPPPPPLQASWLAHVSLRNFSGDSPLEGKSAFAVEMEDTAHTLEVARTLGPRCLVLLDELGKGTEVVAGSALAAAVVQALVGAGAAGVFATHLHDLVYLLRPLQREGRLEYWAMEVVRRLAGRPLAPGLPPRLHPTRRVLTDNKACVRSLGLQVAADCGMQPDVLRAAVLFEQRMADMMWRARAREYGVEEAGEDAVWGGEGSGGTAGVTMGRQPQMSPPLSQPMSEGVVEVGAAEGLLREEAAAWREEEQEAIAVAADGTAEATRAQGAAQAETPGAAAAWGAGLAAAGGRDDTSEAAAVGAEPEPYQGISGWKTEQPPALGGAQVEAAVSVAAAAAVAGQAGGRAQPAVQDEEVVTVGAADVLTSQGVITGGGAVAVSPDGTSSLDASGGGGGGEEEKGVLAATPAAMAAADGLQKLDAAAGMLRDAVRAAMARAGCQLGPDSGALEWLLPEWRPAPGHAGEAAVYVLLRWDGLLYVGESEDIGKRLTLHRRNETKERKALGGIVSAAVSRTIGFYVSILLWPSHTLFTATPAGWLAQTCRTPPSPQRARSAGPRHCAACTACCPPTQAARAPPRTWRRS